MRQGSLIQQSRSFPAEAGLTGTDNGLRSVADLKFAQDVGHVVAHGLLGQNQPARDLVAAPSGGQPASGSRGPHDDSSSPTVWWRRGARGRTRTGPIR